MRFRRLRALLCLAPPTDVDIESVQSSSSEELSSESESASRCSAPSVAKETQSTESATSECIIREKATIHASVTLDSFPTELLEIFTHCTPPDKLMKVCRRWYHILQQNPSLWKSIHLAQWHAPRFLAYLRLSKNTPLTIRIDSFCSSSAAGPISQNAARIESLRIAGSYVEEFMEELRGVDLPVLRSLELEPQWEDFTDMALNLPRPICTVRMPALRSLSLLSIHAHWATVSRLHHLAIEGVHILTFAHLLATLRACPDLRSLRLNTAVASTTPATAATQPIHLPALELLELVHETRHCHNILSHIRLSSTTMVDIFTADRVERASELTGIIDLLKPQFEGAVASRARTLRLGKRCPGRHPETHHPSVKACAGAWFTVWTYPEHDQSDSDSDNNALFTFTSEASTKAHLCGVVELLLGALSPTLQAITHLAIAHPGPGLSASLWGAAFAFILSPSCVQNITKLSLSMNADGVAFFQALSERPRVCTEWIGSSALMEIVVRVPQPGPPETRKQNFIDSFAKTLRLARDAGEVQVDEKKKRRLSLRVDLVFDAPNAVRKNLKEEVGKWSAVRILVNEFRWDGRLMPVAIPKRNGKQTS
ncbi:hypothetical protein C8F01DRAFT_1138089 [Mycena amicta]|nr:hypothetical protein C8F01DRAFT_1138089 [Mycena amicta]